MTRLTAKQKEKMQKLFEQGYRGKDLAERLNVNHRSIYYHQNKFLGSKVKQYVKAIGPDKPNPNKQIGLALIVIGEQIAMIGRTLRGNYSV